MIRHILAAAALLGVLSATPAAAYCFDKAGARYGVSPDLLRAIAWVESAGNAGAINVNRNGSRDVCLMQINSWWLPRLARHGITAERLLREPCTCVMTGAWILAQEVTRHGYTWRAVGHYHSPDAHRAAAYAARVRAAVAAIIRARGQP